MSDQESTENTRPVEENRPAKNEIRKAFVACPRCSYFLVGYGLIHDDLEASMENSGGKWLDLTWSISTRRLVQKSYGVMINQIDSHFEGVCDDCRRPYVFSTSDSEPPEITFSIKITPAR
jgi:hypothetical protein